MIQIASESAAPRRKRSQRAERLRTVILRSAAKCFSDYGFEGASTRMIADQSGITHSLVLYHFESKEMLWRAAVEEVIAEYTSHLREILRQEDKPAVDVLRAWVEEFVKTSAKAPQIYRILTSQSTQESKRMNWLVDHYLRQNFESVCNLIRRGQLEGSVRDGDPARIYYLTLGAAGTPFMVFREYELLTGRDITSAAEIHHLIALIFEVMFHRTDKPAPKQGSRNRAERTQRSPQA